MHIPKMCIGNMRVIQDNRDTLYVAGCWYYNDLSRRSLEMGRMIAASKGSKQ